MKTRFFSLLVAALGCGVACGGTTSVTDFTSLMGGTAVDGITLTATNATLTPTGGLDLTDGSLAFAFNSATNRPSINGSARFSVALTFDLSSLAGTNTTLFSTTWNATPPNDAFKGLYGAKYDNGSITVGYWNNTTAYEGKSVNVEATSGMLTMVWSRPGNYTTLDVYVGDTHVGAITSTLTNETFTAFLNVLSVGGKGTTNSGSHTNSYTAASSADLLGMQVVTGSVMDDAAIKSYIQTVPVPEPATATLSLLALAGLAARRRRK